MTDASANRSTGQPLAGVRVVVTRAREQAREMARCLGELGAIPVELPMIETVAIQSESLDRALSDLASYDWVVFTSSNAVRFVASRMGELRLPMATFDANVRVAAVGRATGRALERESVRVDLLPGTAVAESLVRSMVEREVADARVLLPSSRIARDTVPSGLRDAGAAVEVIPVYDTRLPEAVDAATLRLVRHGAVDIVTFTSPSTVRNFRRLLGSDLDASVRIACIGPTTSDAARENGYRVDIEAADHTVSGVVAAIVGNQERMSGRREETYEPSS